MKIPFIREFNPVSPFLLPCLCLLLLIVAASQAAYAHHSFAVYDFDTEIEFTGEVTELKFRNPHISMKLKQTDADGQEKIIDFIEGAPANMLVRAGLRPNMIKVGTTISVIGSPLREDPDKLFIRAIILEDGTEFRI